MVKFLRPKVLFGLILSLSLLVAACASPYAKNRTLLESQVAPSEIAILAVEDRTSGDWVPADALRSALVSAALDRGFTPLSRHFVDQAGIDPDVPALGQAGVLRLRILSWVDGAEQASSVHLRYHLTLHSEGKVIADILESAQVAADATLLSLNQAARLERMLGKLAAQMMADLPPPPSL